MGQSKPQAGEFAKPEDLTVAGRLARPPGRAQAWSPTETAEDSRAKGEEGRPRVALSSTPLPVRPASGAGHHFPKQQGKAESIRKRAQTLIYDTEPEKSGWIHDGLARTRKKPPDQAISKSD